MTDLDSGAIVSVLIVDAGGDGGQLQPQYEQAQAVLAELGIAQGNDAAQSITTDGAYHDTRQLDALEQQGVQCFVPEDRTTHRMAPGISPEYHADKFTYDESTDTMHCPQRQCMKWRKLNDGKTAAVYQAPPDAEAELVWRQFVNNLMLLAGIWKPMVPAKTG